MPQNALDLDQSLSAKEGVLAHSLSAHTRLLIGFSGGVDSAFLAAAALETLGPDRVLAVIGRSASYPEEQWRTARALADRLGLRVREIDTDEMHDPHYAANPTNRCYFCKSELWSRLAVVAREERFPTIADGTNADDLADWRPGAQAAREHGVISPLAAAGLTKQDIRLLSRARGLPTWSQPSSPCLSSRLPYGTPVTAERLRQVERAEHALRELGIAGDLRVRHHGEVARVEIARELVGEWLRPDHAALIVQAVRDAGFARVALDLRGFRSGSLNVLEGVSAA